MPSRKTTTDFGFQVQALRMTMAPLIFWDSFGGDAFKIPWWAVFLLVPGHAIQNGKGTVNHLVMRQCYFHSPSKVPANTYSNSVSPEMHRCIVVVVAERCFHVSESHCSEWCCQGWHESTRCQTTLISERDIPILCFVFLKFIVPPFCVVLSL